MQLRELLPYPEPTPSEEDQCTTEGHPGTDNSATQANQGSVALDPVCDFSEQQDANAELYHNN